MKSWLALLLLTPAAAFAQATPFDREMARLTRGLPKSVSAFIHRQADCNHWAGEEGYDPARAAEINKAVARLRCQALDRDAARLTHRYSHDARVLRALKTARDRFPV